MSDDTEYETFLKAKMLSLPDAGITGGIEIHDQLKAHQAVGVMFALRRGRSAIFFDTGLGKALVALTFLQTVAKHTGGMVLLLAPLAVSNQFVDTEAPKFGIPAKIVECQADCELGMINVTNYEKLHRFEPSAFAGVAIDESSVLKALDGQLKEKLIRSFAETPFRLALSATPSPNDHKELGNHAEFLGIMTSSEMLAKFFTHDNSGGTSEWKLKAHAKPAFWKWVASWGLMVQKPSDLGFSDEGYVLPKLTMHEHIVEMPADYHHGRGLLVAVEARSLKERQKAKRASLEVRVAACAKMVSETPGQWMVWCHLNDEADALKGLIAGAVNIAGSDKPEVKRDRLVAFANGDIRVVITKPKIAGLGLNLQSCHQTAFVGLNESQEQLYQCIRRFYRFGQENDVDAHLYLSDAETGTLRDLKEKEAKAREMATEMTAATRATTIVGVSAARKESDVYEEDVAQGAKYTFHLGDAFKIIQRYEENSIDYTIFSPPFPSLYAFSNSERDLGNCKDDAEFYDHFRFGVREMLRTTKPGRLLSFHCMDLPALKHRDGFIGIKNVSGQLIDMFEREGWLLHSKTVIWKDPVIAMIRTKAKGILHGNVVKDSADARSGLPDFLITMRKPGDPDVPVVGDYQNAINGLWQLTTTGAVSPENERAVRAYLKLHAELFPSHFISMRKPGDNAVPIVHTKEELSLDEWKEMASPVWGPGVINPSDTLQFRSAGDDDDEKHISPLQCGVVRRGVRLYSNPGEKVASWFGGIGTEGVVALELKREAVLCELKKSYFQLGVKNLAMAEAGPQQLSLLG